VPAVRQPQPNQGDTGPPSPPAVPLGQAMAMPFCCRVARTGLGMAIVAAFAVLSGCGGGADHTVSASESTTATTMSPSTTPQASEASGGAAPLPPPCPTDSNTPSMATGTYCGPAPRAGNGLGPNGECDGSESLPPCGPGVVVGAYYTYTQPQDCSGNPIHFDGRLWYSTLQPSTDRSDTYVWMALEPNDQLEAISPTESIGFKPDEGQAPVSTCK